MSNVNKFVAMLSLQDKMNSKVNGNWRIAGNNWMRAVWIEGGELVDSMPWKWWKKGQVADYANVKIEIVDKWHFILSQLLLKDELYTDIANRIEGYHDVANKFNAIDNDQFVINCAEEVVFAALCVQQPTRNNLFCVEEYAHRYLVKSFFELMYAAGMTLDELYKIYVGKNVLNIFRQDHGYKEGTYIKIWNGEEDNVHLNRLMEVNDIGSETFIKDITSALEEMYAATELHAKLTA